MKYFLTLILITYACLSLRLAPTMRNDLALWTQVTVASPTLARGWQNLAAAIVRRDMSMQAGRVYYERARTLAQRPHVDESERRLITAQADQALTLIIGEKEPVRAGMLMDEAMRLWPEGFPMSSFVVEAPK